MKILIIVTVSGIITHWKLHDPQYDYLIMDSIYTQENAGICKAHGCHYQVVSFRSGILFAWEQGYDYVVWLDEKRLWQIPYVDEMYRMFIGKKSDVVTLADPFFPTKMFNRKAMYMYLSYPRLRPGAEMMAFFIRKGLRIEEIVVEETGGKQNILDVKSVQRTGGTLKRQWFFLFRREPVECKPYETDTLQRLHETLLEIMLEFKHICEQNHLSYFLVYGTALGAVRHQGFIPWDDDADVGMLREDYEKFINICNHMEDSCYEILSVENERENCSVLAKFQKKDTSFVSQYSVYLKNNIGISLDIFPFDDVKNDAGILKRQMLSTMFWSRLLFLRGTPYPMIPYAGFRNMVAKAVCMSIYSCLGMLHISPQWLYRQFKKAAMKYDKKGDGYVTCFIAPVNIRDCWNRQDIFPLKDITFENHMFKAAKNNEQMLRDTYGRFMELPPEEKRVNHKPVKLIF